MCTQITYNADSEMQRRKILKGTRREREGENVREKERRGERQKERERERDTVFKGVLGRLTDFSATRPGKTGL